MSSLPVLSTPQQVLDFWFGDSRSKTDLTLIKSRNGLWFGGASPEFDATQAHNADLIESLIQDTCDKSVWNINDDPHAAMAKVIVLDQFSRCAHRGTPKAFAGDEICAALSKSIIEDQEKNWFLNKYSPIERFFLTVSLIHSELLSNQELALATAPRCGEDCGPEIDAHFKGSTGFHQSHYNVIKRFGRFPHRNEHLGRDSTQEEIEWLNSPECPGWAKSQQKKK